MHMIPCGMSGTCSLGSIKPWRRSENFLTLYLDSNTRKGWLAACGSVKQKKARLKARKLHGSANSWTGISRNFARHSGYAVTPGCRIRLTSCAVDTDTANHQVPRRQHHRVQDIKPSELLSTDNATNDWGGSSPDENAASVSVLAIGVAQSEL